MRRIVYTNHLKHRLRIRRIPDKYPRQIFHSPDQTFSDTLDRHSIAIKKLRYNRKDRNMMIAYTQKNSTVEIITIHPIAEEKIINRVICGRWTKQ